MRSETEIQNRIDGLKRRLEERKKRRRAMRPMPGSGRPNALGTSNNRRAETEIQALTWVLEKSN